MVMIVHQDKAMKAQAKAPDHVTGGSSRKGIELPGGFRHNLRHEDTGSQGSGDGGACDQGMVG
jgi:hypothetical protein